MMRLLWAALIGLSLVLPVSASSIERFTVADYKALIDEDIQTARMILVAMREAVFYAQESTGQFVVCASPRPISGKRLMEMLEVELQSPTNALARTYEADDQLAFAFLQSLKSQEVCK